MPRGVYVHPGHFFDFEDEAYAVVSLLTPEPELREGIRRVECPRAAPARASAGLRRHTPRPRSRRSDQDARRRRVAYQPPSASRTEAAEPIVAPFSTARFARVRARIAP